MRLVKIATLTAKQKDFLRKYWKDLWPSWYVDDLLGKKKSRKKKRKARAHDRVIFTEGGRTVKGKVLNIIQDRASVATADFVHILPVERLEVYKGD